MGLAVIAGSLAAPHWGAPAAAALVTAAYPGSTAPDWLEIRIGSRTLIPHRTITHWLLPWLALLGVAAYMVALSPLAGAALLGFALGGLSHWVGDFGTPMGVPVVNPTRRRSMNLWAT